MYHSNRCIGQGEQCVRCGRLRIAIVIWSSDTWATWWRTAELDLQTASSIRRSRDLRPYWRRSGRSSCTRIRRRWARRSCPGSCFRSICRCRDHTWWTSYRRGSWVRHRRRCPSTRPPAACSCVSRSLLWRCCTRRSTSPDLVPVGQTAACSGRSSSAGWAGRCRASSCRSSRWIRL